LFVARLVEKSNRHLFSEEFAAPFPFAILATLTLISSIFFMHPINHTENRKNRWAVENRNRPFFTPDFIVDFERLIF